jgi:phytoene synthase
VTPVTSPVTSWEKRLLDLAYQPLASKNDPIHIATDAQMLARAYEQSAALTQQHSKTFYLASGLLPQAKRRAVRALYAFCRVSDDLVDRAADDPLSDIQAWRERALADHYLDDNPAPIALAWGDTRARYNIPVGYAHQLLDSVTQDLQVTRYATFDDLAEYAYGVASTVGLMAMHIIGLSNEEAIPYAIKLGVALQLTNILRDVGEDWRKGRLYLPLDELDAFGLNESDVAQGVEGKIDHRWRALMRFQIARNCRLYAEALPGIAMLHPDGRFAIAAAAELYRAILNDIEAHNYNVFARRSYVSLWNKLRRLPGIWWRARRNGYREVFTG